MDSQFVSMDVSAKFKDKYPQLSRDAGGGVLYLIHESSDGLPLKNSVEFSGDSLFCEWAYVVDLDKRTFEVYRGFNKEAISEKERFAQYFQKRDDDGQQYYPIKLLKTYSLDDLPDEARFLAETEMSDDED